MLLFLIASQRPFASNTTQRALYGGERGGSNIPIAQQPPTSYYAPPYSPSYTPPPRKDKDDTALREARERIKELEIREQALLKQLEALQTSKATTEQELTIKTQEVTNWDHQLQTERTQTKQAFLALGNKSFLALAAYLRDLPSLTQVNLTEQTLFFNPTTFASTPYNSILALDRDQIALFKQYEILEIFASPRDINILQIQEFRALTTLIANDKKYHDPKKATTKEKYAIRYTPESIEKLRTLIEYMMTSSAQLASQKPKPTEVNIENLNPWKEYFESIAF